MISGIQLRITAGRNVILRSPRLELRSRRHAPVSGATVHVPDLGSDLASTFAEGDAVRIEYGYRGGASAVWNGTLRGLERVNRDQFALLADGADLLLTVSRVRECYADESSLAIARYLFNSTGLPVAAVAIPDEIVPRFPVAAVPVWQAVRQLLHTLERGYGHDMRRTAFWLGADGLYLGDLDESGAIPLIATGENLIRHLPSDAPKGLHEVETFLLPGLTHSRRFRLTDLRLGVDAAYRAQEVRHVIEPDKTRTFIRYGREHAWC